VRGTRHLLPILALAARLFGIVAPVTAATKVATTVQTPKVEPSLAAAIAKNAGKEFRVIVQAEPAKTKASRELNQKQVAAQIRQKVDGKEGKIQASLGIVNGYAATLTGKRILQLARTSGVRAISGDHQVTLHAGTNTFDISTLEAALDPDTRILSLQTVAARADDVGAIQPNAGQAAGLIHGYRNVAPGRRASPTRAWYGRLSGAPAKARFGDRRGAGQRDSPEPRTERSFRRRRRGRDHYFRLSGTSMASPVVAGTATMILTANPNLTPNQVKYVLTKTARKHSGISVSAQGAGSVNAFAAVHLAYQGVGSNQANLRQRPSDIFARSIYPLAYAAPLIWRQSGNWDSGSWDSVAWDNLCWKCIDCASADWSSVSWESLTGWASGSWDSGQWDAAEVDDALEPGLTDEIMDYDAPDEPHTLEEGTTTASTSSAGAESTGN